MREIPEQQIAAMAPNANAVNNARKIVKSGGFTEHARSEDDTFYMGSCKGSGSSATVVAGATSRSAQALSAVAS